MGRRAIAPSTELEIGREQDGDRPDDQPDGTIAHQTRHGRPDCESGQHGGGQKTHLAAIPVLAVGQESEQVHEAEDGKHDARSLERRHD